VVCTEPVRTQRTYARARAHAGEKKRTRPEAETDGTAGQVRPRTVTYASSQLFDPWSRPPRCRRRRRRTTTALNSARTRRQAKLAGNLKLPLPATAERWRSTRLTCVPGRAALNYIDTGAYGGVDPYVRTNNRCLCEVHSCEPVGLIVSTASLSIITN
jgi:hypothetical protein